MHKDLSFWKNKKVFITGHTGFKGSWLSIFLKKLEVNLYGYSLKEEKNSLFNKARVSKLYDVSEIGNIKDFNKLKKTLNKTDPEIIFHLAAQPLVVESYRDPKNTFETNIMGTVNLLEISRSLKKLKVIVIVTTDKVYKILKSNPEYNEKDNLGASDPYATSKACVEFVTESYHKSFYINKKNLNVVTVRAGNVIGGGDYSANRIVPDYLRSYNNKKKLKIRNPNSVRPWQHVLEPLYGYILLAQNIYNKKINTKKFESWNFGPPLKSFITVKKLIEKFQSLNYLKNKVLIKFAKENKKLIETNVLKINSKKSFKKLKWRPIFTIDETISEIINWNRIAQNKKNYLDTCYKQIENFLQKI